jgi:hypothetical protein
MAIIEAIIDRRRKQPFWDPKLWDFVERVECVPRDKLNDTSVSPRSLYSADDCISAGPLNNIRPSGHKVVGMTMA